MTKDKNAQNFVVSCDTCADLPKSWYEKNDVRYMTMKRILNGEEISECFDTDAEFDKFYEGLKKGEQPTTVAINEFEFLEHFRAILKKDLDKDIVHISLSSGLSVTFDNAVRASETLNEELKKSGKTNKVHILDSLTGTLAIGQQVEEIVAMRNGGMKTTDAIELTKKIRDLQQGWVVMTDLFHLKRGGRIKASAAVIGAVLKIRPVIHISPKGKLPVENKVSGNFKAVKYILSRIAKYRNKSENTGLPKGVDDIWVVRTSESEFYELMRDSIRSEYPDVNIRTGIVGQIIGSHLGCGGVGILFSGSPRLEID